MRKYIIKNADGSEQNEMQSVYDSDFALSQAEELLEFLNQ